MSTFPSYYDDLLNKIFMTSSSQILVGLDFSLLDQVLIKKAHQIAERLNAHKLVFLHIMSSEEVPDQMRADFKIINEQELTKCREAMQEEVEDHLPAQPTMEIEYVVKKGSPVHLFMSFCQERHIALLVMGKKKELHGENIISYELMRYSHCPVLFVPETSRLRLHNIMVCNEFSAFSKSAMEMAIALAADAETNTSIISEHVFHTDFPEDDYRHDKVKEMYNAFIDDINLRDVHVTPTFQETSNMPVHHRIYQDALKKKVDLLIVGSRGRSVAAPPFINSMTEKLLRLVNDIPILVTRRPVEPQASDINDDAAAITQPKI